MTRPGEIFIAPKLAEKFPLLLPELSEENYKYVRPRLNPIFLQ
jgi:hypothetical protein